jgi:hypothetical protein
MNMGWKLLEGKGYSTVEWGSLNGSPETKDVEALKDLFWGIPSGNRVTVVVPAGYHSEELKELGLTKINEREVFYKDLRGTTVFPDTSLEFIAEPCMEEGIRCLGLILGSQDEAQVMLDSLFSEIDSNRFRIYLVRKSGRDAGFFIPHIEPCTESEGRLFFMGITPSFRGLGLASTVHQFAAAALRLELNADTYIGVTDMDNLPMKQVFSINGCKKIQTLAIYSAT